MGNNIQCLFTVILLCISIVPADAQSSPKWLNPTGREMSFSSEVYFSEFTQGNLQSDENVSALLERLKTDAKRGAAGNIYTLIEAKIDKKESQIVCNQQVAFNSVYQDYTQQSISAEITGFSVETYYDEQKKWGYAFAYVKKSDLVAYYKARIDLQLQKVESALSNVKGTISTSTKMQAYKSAEQVLELLAKAEFAQNLLSTITPQDEESLQTERFFRLKKELFQILTDLEQSTYLYVQCIEDNYGQTVRILEQELKRILSTQQCSLVDDASQADYIVTIKASTRQHDGATVFSDSPFKYSVADVDVELYSNKKKVVVYNEAILQKNNKDGATYESAGRNALKVAAGKVWDGIKPWIVGK